MSIPSGPVPPRLTPDDRFAASVNSARTAFETSLCEHAVLVDTQALGHVLEAFDEAVSTIAAAVLDRAKSAD